LEAWHAWRCLCSGRKGTAAGAELLGCRLSHRVRARVFPLLFSLELCSLVFGPCGLRPHVSAAMVVRSSKVRVAKKSEGPVPRFMGRTIEPSTAWINGIDGKLPKQPTGLLCVFLCFSMHYVPLFLLIKAQIPSHKMFHFQKRKTYT
jgi:hypothetical protein